VIHGRNTGNGLDDSGPFLRGKVRIELGEAKRLGRPTDLEGAGASASGVAIGLISATHLAC